MADCLSLLRYLTSHLTIMFEVLDRVGHERPVLLQKAVHFHARFKAEQLPDIGFRQPVAPISIERDGFEHETGRVLTLGDEWAGEFVREIDG